MTKPLVERVLSIVVLPESDPIFSEMATRVDIVDEAGGEFLEVWQPSGRPDANGKLQIDPNQWPALRQAIDRMVGECRSEEK